MINSLAILILLNGVASFAEPRDSNDLPPDIEAAVHSVKYNLTNEQKSLLNNPVIEGEGNIQITYPQKEGGILRISILAPEKSEISNTKEFKQYLNKFSSVIGFEPRYNSLRDIKHSFVKKRLHIWQLQQYFGDTPVDGARIVVRARAGLKPYSISGVYYRTIAIKNIEKISLSTAKETAVLDLNEKVNGVDVNCKKVLLPYGRGIHFSYRCLVNTKRGPFLTYIDAENSKILKRTYLVNSVSGNQ